MALQTSGQISLGDVRTELGSSGQTSLGSSVVRDLFGVSSGEIQLTDGYGASSGFHAIAYVDNTGNFAGEGASIQILDVSNINQPTKVATINRSPGNNQMVCDTNLNHLYFVDKDTGELVRIRVYELSNIQVDTTTTPIPAGGNSKIGVDIGQFTVYVIQSGTLYRFSHDFAFSPLTLDQTGPTDFHRMVPITDSNYIFATTSSIDPDPTRIAQFATFDGNIEHDTSLFNDFGISNAGDIIEYDKDAEKLILFDSTGGSNDPITVVNLERQAGTIDVSIDNHAQFSGLEQGAMVLFPEVKKIFFAGLDNYSLLSYDNTLTMDNQVSRLGIRNDATRIGDTNYVASVGSSSFYGDEIHFYEVNGNNLTSVGSFDDDGGDGIFSDGPIVYLGIIRD